MRSTSPRAFAVYALIAGVASAGTWAYAQGFAVPAPVAPVVLAGPDIGFRMQGRKGDTPVGELVVKVNGEWKTVEFSVSARPLF